MDCDFPPIFPPELDSLHTLKTKLNSRFLLRKVNLPRNLKVWECELAVSRFKVPKLVCNHPSLEIWKIDECYFAKMRFPQDVKGNLRLRILDLPEVSCDHTDQPTGSDKISQFYDNVERYFGRVLVTRPKDPSCRHFLVDR